MKNKNLLSSCSPRRPCTCRAASYVSSVLNEDKDRELALQMDLVLLERCDELWVFGETITSGMKAEIAYANNKNMKIRFFKQVRRI